MDDAAKALADELYYNTPHEKLTENEFASGIYDGKYYTEGPTPYGPDYSYTGDPTKPEHVAGFHSHPVQQSQGFSGEDIEKVLYKEWLAQSDCIEYLFHKDNETNRYVLIRYDKSVRPGHDPFIPVQTYPK